VGIVTIMTIAVSERTNEIGLMMALGAQRATVLFLFLGESVVLATLGGLFGLLIGVVTAQLLQFLLPSLPVHTPWRFAIISLLVSMMIGLLAGVMPARSASKLDPINALRAE